MRYKNARNDSDSLTPEELELAIKLFRESQTKPVIDVDGDESTMKMPDEGNSESESKNVTSADEDSQGSTAEDIVNIVKEHKAGREDSEGIQDVETAKEVINQQDADIDMLLAALEKILGDRQIDLDSEEKVAEDTGNVGSNEEDENKDGSDDKSTSLNADSADKIIRQRLNICRVGDKLNLDGLENMSIKQAKKTIITKVLPAMRLDGKSDAYVDAAYDLAVGEVNKRKSITYQKQQMMTQSQKNRLDSGESMAMSARKKMIAREGGNK